MSESTGDRPSNPNLCEECGKPATQWIRRDPFGKSDAMRPACADHGSRLRDPADVAEIERLTRELEASRLRADALLEAECDKCMVRPERDRLRVALEDIRGCKLATQCGIDPMRAAGIHNGLDITREIADKALSGEPTSAHETAGDWLTNEQCDDVIALLEDYEWTGLTRENVRTWCTAIAEARSSVKAADGPGEEDGPWAEGWDKRSGRCICEHHDRYHFDDGTGFVRCRATADCNCKWPTSAQKASDLPSTNEKEG